MRWTIPVVVVLLAVSFMPLTADGQQTFPCDFYGLPDPFGAAPPMVSEPGPYDILPQEVVWLTSELDGASIQMAIIRPDVPEGTEVPVVLQASPYFHPLHTIDLADCESFLVENYVPHGFALAFLAVRGTGDSGGCMDLMGPAEQHDVDQAITWLGTRDWSTGDVGMIGLSYDGATAWEGAASGNPHLETIVPMSAVHDMYDLMFRDGAVEWRGPVVLNAIYYLQSIGFYPVGRSVEHTAEVTACPGYADSLAASAYSGVTGERDPGGFWAARNLDPAIDANYEGSIFLVQGLVDWNVDPGHQYPWFHTLEEKDLETRVMLGQWGHRQPTHEAWPDLLLAWFDQELRDGPGMDAPRVLVQDSTDAWRGEEAWPPADAVGEVWLPAADGSLSTTGGPAGQMPVGPHPGQVQPAFLTYSSRLDENLYPACAESCVVFETEAFDEAYRFAGIPLLEATVTPTGPLGHLTAALYAVSDGGNQRLGWGQVDLRFAQGGETGELPTPGQPLDVRIPLEPLDAVVPAGATLSLVVSQGSTTDRFPTVPSSPVVLHVGDGATTLTLSTFQR